MVGIDTLIHTPKVYENELPLFFTHPNNSFSLTQVMVHLSLSFNICRPHHKRNDFLDNKCDISTAEQVASNIVTVISHVVDNSSNENIKILYFGYSVPSQDVCKNGMTAQLFEEQGAIIFETIQASDYAKYVTLVDISEMFVKTSWGGSSSSSNGLSDSYYYYDEIHLNQLGYLHLFSSYRIQRFFGCSAAQTVELKGISAALEAKDNPAHLAGTIITTLLGLLMGIIGLVLVVNFIKRKMAMRGGMSSSGGSSSINSKELLDESENTGDYVVVKEEPAVMA